MATKGVKQQRLTEPQYAILREKYITLNASGGKIALLPFCKQENVKYEKVKKRAQRENWVEMVNRRVLDREKAIAEQMTLRSAEVMAAVRKNLHFDEIEIRQRHGNISKQMMLLAAGKLKLIKSEDLSVQNAIDLMRLALAEERKAYGLPDTYLEAQHTHLLVSKAQEVFEQHLKKTSKVRKALADLAAIVEGTVTKKTIKQLPAPDAGPDNQ